MTDATDTIDRDRFWREADDAERESATASAHHARQVLGEFLAETGAPDSFADVGCGTGNVTVDVAEPYPDATVVGYDAAESVLVENRRRVRDHGLSNLRFERVVLPEFDPDLSFAVVFCYATLGYVSDPERAVANLYDAVEPGGHLVCSYPNSLAQAHYREVAAATEEHLPTDSGFDSDRFADRFRLVVEGESLLSYRQIHDVLGTWPQSVWSVVEKPDVRFAWRHHPLVYVPK